MSAVTVREIAERLDMPTPHVCSWAVAWHGPIGSGHLRPLTLVDLCVARAWQVLGGAWAGHGQYYGKANERQRRAEAAIRSDPRRWLLIDERRAETFDEAEDAGLAGLWSHDTPAATLIDLWSVPDDTPDQETPA